MTTRRLAAYAAVIALAAGGCAPEKPAPPFETEVLSYVGAGRYEIRPEPLASLTDFGQLQGEAARFRGGGSIRVSFTADLGTEEKVRHELRVQDAHDIHLDYELAGGVVRSHDYDTLAMLSLYRSFERTRAFYLGLGTPESAVAALPLYFRPRLEVSFFLLLASSNAAYTAPVDSFLFFNDFFSGANVPIALNLGVVAHEYGHSVWQHLVWGDKLEPWSFESWPDETVNHLRGLNEGLSDVFGATITGDPRFVGASIPRIEAERDLAVARDFRASDRSTAEASTNSFNPYWLGSIVASALWTAGDTAGREAVAAYLIRAHQRIAGHIDRRFRTGQYLDQVVAAAAAAAPAHAAALCAVLADRLDGLGPFACCVASGAALPEACR